MKISMQKRLTLLAVFGTVFVVAYLNTTSFTFAFWATVFFVVGVTMTNFQDTTDMLCSRD